MKILIAANYSSVYGGNFIPAVKEFARYCRIKGDEVGFAFPIGAQNREWCVDLKKEYPIYYIGNQGNSIEAKKLNQYIKIDQYDSLYVHFSLGLVFQLSLLNPNLTIVRHTHTDMGEASTLKTKIKMWLKRNIFYPRMAHIYVSKRLQSMEGMANKSNSLFLSNALVDNRFDLDKLPAYRAELRQKFAISDRDRVILMFGWHIKVKGVDIALRAFEKILHKKPMTVLFIVMDEKVGNDFAKKYVSSETLKHVFFLPPMQKIEKYYAASDIFLSSSRSEGFPYSILEALYFGKYVVTSSLDAVQWALKYKSVLGFESENIDDCVRKMCTTIEKTYMDIDSIGQREVEKQVRAEYSIEKWNEAVYEVLEKQYRKINQK